MIVVRDVFRIHPERMKEAVSLLREGRGMIQSVGFSNHRALTDLAGENYTLVLEIEVADLGAWERTLKQGFADPKWQAWYSKFRPLIAGGRREIFTLVE
jgi:hypothetical protein